jgi:hypothetical protein
MNQFDIADTSDPSSSMLNRLRSTILWVVLGVGILFRAREFGAARSLWLDEIALILQLNEHNFWQLLTSGIQGNQGAPALYLCIEKIAIALLKPIEHGSRLVALCAGVGTLFLVRSLVKNARMSFYSKVFFLLCLGTAPLHVYYSAAAKQYMVETCVVLIILLSYERYATNALSLGWLIAILTFAVWLSHSAVYAIFACGTVSLLWAYSNNSYGEIRKLIFVSSLAALSFALHFVVNIYPLLGNKALYGYWSNGIAPLHKGFIPTLLWSFGSLHHLISYTFIPQAIINDSRFSTLTIAWSGILMLLFLRGAFILWRSDKLICMYCLGTIGAVFLGSLLRLSPFRDRLILCVTPLVMIFVVQIPIRKWTSPKLSQLQTFFSLCGVLLVAVPPLVITSDRFFKPADRNNMKHIIRYLQKEHSADEPILMRSTDLHAFYLYKNKYKISSLPVVNSNWQISSAKRMIEDLKKRIEASPTKSVWIISAFRSAEVAGAIQLLEEKGLVAKKKDINDGYASALFEGPNHGQKIGP